VRFIVFYVQSLLCIKFTCFLTRVLIFEETVFECTAQCRGCRPEREINFYSSISSPIYMLNL